MEASAGSAQRPTGCALCLGSRWLDLEAQGTTWAQGPPVTGAKDTMQGSGSARVAQPPHPCCSAPPAVPETAKSHAVPPALGPSHPGEPSSRARAKPCLQLLPPVLPGGTTLPLPALRSPADSVAEGHSSFFLVHGADPAWVSALLPWPPGYFMEWSHLAQHGKTPSPAGDRCGYRQARVPQPARCGGS